jgi:arylsulfatase A-like enzyme
MSKVLTIAVLAFMFGFTGCSEKTERTDMQLPNIIYIMIDDLGYGDIGCYNSSIQYTPHIDRLAKDGIMLSDFHSNGPMCTPTRVAFLTGRYQYRFGPDFESALGYKDGLPIGTYSVADALKQAGYATAIYGKWHIGFEPPYLPPGYGFDDFIGLATGDGDHHTHIARAGHKDWWHNDALQMEKGYSTDLIHTHSIEFIKKNKDRPFFLYISHLAIHFPWQGPDDPPHRKEGVDYGKNKFGIIPDSSNVRPHIEEMIKQVDNGVGEIVKTLEALNIGKNTLIVFTSDNGGYGQYSDKFFNISSNGPFRGQKGKVYEGGHRVPCIFYWPGKIAPGQISDDLVMTMDMFPTFVQMSGSELPDTVHLDGISVLHHVIDGEDLPERIVGWKKRDISAIRKGNWKFCMIEGEEELYNLELDINEEIDLSEIMTDKMSELTKDHQRWIRDVTSSYPVDTED